MTIKAKPTIFRSIEYRSILESEWAKWLYDRRFNAQYEKRKFKLERGIWYLPDFYIPETRTFIEVKGNMERIHKPYQLTQELRRECPHWPDGGTMLLLAGPVGTFYNIEQPFYMGLNYTKCPNCKTSNILTEYGDMLCRYCGAPQTTLEKLLTLTKPLKWLLLERD